MVQPHPDLRILRNKKSFDRGEIRTPSVTIRTETETRNFHHSVVKSAYFQYSAHGFEVLTLVPETYPEDWNTYLSYIFRCKIPKMVLKCIFYRHKDGFLKDNNLNYELIRIHQHLILHLHS